MELVRGVTPKWVLERIRLHEAAERMGEGDWASMALDLGRSPADYALRASATVA